MAFWEMQCMSILLIPFLDHRVMVKIYCYCTTSAPEGRLGVLADVNTGHGFFSAGTEQVVYSWSKYLCFHGNYLEKFRVYLLCCFVLFDTFVQDLNGSVTHPR
jgi:hypothetical protein